MTDSLLTANPREVAEAADGVDKPAWLPAKFWDPELSDVRLEALAKAYVALENRLHALTSGGGKGDPKLDKVRAAMGVPGSPDAYRLTVNPVLGGPDGEVNRRLHQAGFTEAQAQVVYDLAAERLLPAAEAMAADFEADRQLARLVEHFGGEEAWNEVSRQLLTWGQANLPPGVLNALSGTFEGVLALKGMMEKGGEPGLKGSGGPRAATAREDELKAMMRDPRYWRDRDPALIDKVAQGFKRLYPGQSQG